MLYIVGELEVGAVLKMNSIWGGSTVKFNTLRGGPGIICFSPDQKLPHPPPT